MKRTFLIQDPLNDDFAGNRIRHKQLSPHYRYTTRNPLRKLFDFLLHHFIAVPIVFVYQKVVFGERIVNRKALYPYLLSGCYLYGNHTRKAGDAFTPHLALFPRKAYILINSDAVAIPVVRHLVKSLGGVPVPDTLAGMRPFRKEMTHLAKHDCVAIYPEAHIWPFYTGIRPFRDTSFRYPVESGKPAFALTVTYRRRLLTRLMPHLFPRPGTTVYVDGPFFPDPSLPVREATRKLCEDVHAAMCLRAEKSDYAYYTYIESEESA